MRPLLVNQKKAAEMTNQPVYPIACRPDDAPALFNVSKSTIYRWAKQGHIKIHKRAGSSFLNVEEVRSFLFGLGDQMGDREA